MKPDLDSISFQEVAKMTDTDARMALESLRWPDGPACLRCGSMSGVVAVSGGRSGLYRCKDCRKAGEAKNQFTVTVGTIFEDSHIPLSKWMQAFSIVCASKKGVSALQLQRQLQLGSYRSAWHMAHRIRHAMSSGPFPPLDGTVEVDETYVGGKPRNKGYRFTKGKAGRGTSKAPVVAIIQRNGKARAFSVQAISSKDLKKAINENVSLRARLMTDAYVLYRKIGAEYADHQTVNHSAGEYARGAAHVNTCESFFALLKRAVHGAFHHVSRAHLGRYCDEFEFRWDYRDMKDGQRTVTALNRVEGRRLMYRDLAGKMSV